MSTSIRLHDNRHQPVNAATAALLASKSACTVLQVSDPKSRWRARVLIADGAVAWDRGLPSMAVHTTLRSTSSCSHEPVTAAVLHARGWSSTASRCHDRGRTSASERSQELGGLFLRRREVEGYEVAVRSRACLVLGEDDGRAFEVI